MKHLIQAQWYQLLHTRVYYMVFITFLALAALIGAADFLNGPDNLDEGQLMTASDFATRMSMVSFLAMGGMGFFGTFLCAGDFADRTANYELTSGRLRFQSFLARCIVTVIVNVLFGLLMLTVSLLTSTVLCGWGDSLPGSAVVSRILLCVFPFFRFSCFTVMLAYLIKRPGIAFLGCYGAISAVSLLQSLKKGTHAILTSDTLNELLHYSEWHTFGLARDADVIYSPELEGTVLVSAVILSLVFGMAYLAVGFFYFHGDDLE